MIRWEEELVPYGEPAKRVKVVAPDGTIICDNEPYYPMELLEENADIIGAAPELLEAAKVALKTIEYYEDTPADRSDMAGPDLLRAAIAKVKGEGS